MVTVVLTLIVAIPLIASSFRAVPAGSVGLVERLGRLLPGLRKPGFVAMRPFTDRLIVIPVEPFQVVCATKATVAGADVKLTFDARCVIQDPVKYHLNVPPVRIATSNTRTENFLSGLLDSEGRALLRELSADDGIADTEDYCRRLEGRLEWHTRSVGIKLSELRVFGLGQPPQAT